jgi:hypothetical protein
MEEKQINYIFYLQTKTELDYSFIELSDILSKFNISLLPVTVEDLRIISKNTKIHLVVLRKDLSTHFAFNDLRTKFLDLALISNRINLCDVSSFSTIEIAGKCEKAENYRFINLPASFKQIAMTLALDYFKEKNKTDEWPGGRRAKLPPMNEKN